MSEESALTGTPLQIEFEGTAYKIGLVTGRVKADFEQRFIARARAKVQERKKLVGMNRKEYLDELRRIDEREERGEYAFLSASAIQSAVTSEWGRKMLLELLMPDCPKDTLARLLDERSDELGWLLYKVIEDSMADTLRRAKEKKGKKPPFGLVEGGEQTSSATA